MSAWIEVGGEANHRVQLLDGGAVLWEHDTPVGYGSPVGEPLARHQVSPAAGAVWQVVTADPLTLLPSLHCDPALGGCGAHGFVREGRWL